MKNTIQSRFLKAALLGVAGLLLSAATTFAQNFHVLIDTSALNLPVNSSSAPFAIDFQLNSGDTLNNNTAVINNFTFGGGGGPFGSTNLFGGASGGLPGTITLSDTFAFNEFFQSFTFGTSLAFDVSLTQNVDAGPTPDGFSIAILDSNFANIPTNGLGDSLLAMNANTGTVLGAGTGTFEGVSVLVTPIPEPSTYSLLAGVVALVGVWRRRSICRA